MQQDLVRIQTILSQKIIIPERGGYFPKTGDVLLSLDIQYLDDQAFIGGEVMLWGEEKRQGYAAKGRASFPYVSGFFSFREGPPLYQFVRHLAEKEGLSVDLIIVDGHGIAHPREFGVACWLGLALEIPCLGFAKRSLLPYTQSPANAAGSVAEVFFPQTQKVVGYVLRTQTGVKPVFVSPGHLLSLGNSVKIVASLQRMYRIPDTLRAADQIARAFSRGEAGTYNDLGEVVQIPNPIFPN